MRASHRSADRRGFTLLRRNRVVAGVITPILVIGLALSGTTAYAEEPAPEPTTTESAPAPEETEPAAEEAPPAAPEEETPAEPEAEAPAEPAPAEPAKEEATTEEDAGETVAPLAKAAAPIEALAVATCDLVGGFEIDGNYAAGDCGGTDWTSGGYSSSAVVGTYKVVKDNSDPSDWETGGGTPPKIDFIRNYTKADTVGGDYFLWVGWDREQTSGTGGYVIEVTNAGVNFGPDGAPQPIRSSGGAVFYITTQGSSPPVLLQACVYTSTANYPGTCDASPTAAGFVGAVSTEDLTNPFGQSIEAGGFFEVGMNVTELTNGVVQPGCPAPEAATAYQRSFTGNNFGPTGNLKGFVGPSVVEPPSTCGSLTIIKENAAGARLAGAQFSITPNPVTGTGSTTGTTNAQGEIVFSGTVKPGNYVVTETVPPAGYLLPTPATQNVAVASLQSASVTFVDPLGTLSWNKVDRAGAALGGATFSVTATGGAAAAAPWELDANPITVVDNTGQGGYTGRDTNPAPGAFTVTGLPTGTYSVAETQAPPEYVLDPTPQNATISQATPNPVISTSFVNTPFATVTVQKSWVNAFDGDTATLSVTGGADAVDTAPGSGATATVKVAPGSAVTVSEVLGANNQGSYDTTIMCVGADPSATTGTSAQVTVPAWPASANGVQCTFTNEARETTITLKKTWVDGQNGDSVDARIDVLGGDVSESFTSVSNGDSGSWTDPGSATATVRVGELFSITETYGDDPAGTYASQWQCTGTGLPANPVGGVSSALGFPNGLTAPEGDATCEFTNTNGKFNVVFVKEWINGEAGDAAELTIDPGEGEATGTSISNGQLGVWIDPANSVTKAMSSGEPVTVEEILTTLPAGSEDLYDSSISCTDSLSFLDPQLEPTFTSDGEAGERSHTFTMPSQAVVCVVTNEAEAPTLELIKTVAGAEVAETNWQLFGTLSSGPVITNADGGDVAATELPAGVDVDLSEELRVDFAGSGEFEAGEWMCFSGNTPIELTDSEPGAATLPGLGKGEDVVCGIVNQHVPPGVEFEKTVVSSTDDGDGAWTVVYEVTVTNKSVIVPVEYDLADTLTDYADAVEYVSASWTGPTSGSFALPSLTADLAEGQMLDAMGEGTGTDVYTVTVELEVGATANELEPCVDAETGIGVLNTAVLTVDGETTESEACATVEYDDVSIVKTAELPGEESSVEPGDVFDYVLTVTNNGTRPAENVQVTDDSLNDRLQITALTVDPDAGWGPAPGYSNNEVDLVIASIPVGGSVEVRVSVLFFSPDPVIEEEGVDSGPIEPPVVVEELLNTACVAAERDNDPTNNCDSVEVPTRDVVAYVYTKCINDAPILGWSITKSQSLVDEPIEFLWVPNNADVTPETSPAQVALTQPGGTTTWAQEIAWPGAAFTPSGISIDYPGWRPLEASDYVPDSSPQQYFLPGTDQIMTPGEQAQFVFNGLILDPSELDFAWRGLTDITFTVNPTLSYSTGYPPATPDCVAARNTELEIEKSASVERTQPGEAFSYDLAVENVSDDAAAEGVVITDQIPTDLRVTDITWPGEGDAAVFPNWETCEVSGADAAGYGGTLECVLFGPLQPINSDNGGATAAPTITLSTTVRASSAESVITNVAVVDYHTFGNPEDTGRDADDATVLLSALPPTGSGPMLPLTLMALAALFAGLAAVFAVKRRRGEFIDA
jgi:uncharacterized repeat protein (TIGR01451 family)